MTILSKLLMPELPVDDAVHAGKYLVWNQYITKRNYSISVIGLKSCHLHNVRNRRIGLDYWPILIMP